MKLSGTYTGETPTLRGRVATCIGIDGDDGITPHIGENGNWFIGENDTGKPSRGEQGEPGSDANVTRASIKAALGYTPADDDEVKRLSDNRYALTDADRIEIAQKAADMINDPIGGGLDVELTAEETAELESTIADLKSLKTANTAIIAFLADLHIGTGTPTKIKKAVYGFNSIADSVKTDLLLYGGDYMDNNPTTTKAQALSMFTNLRSVLSLADDTCPAAVIKGNHDDNTMYTDYANGLVDIDTFWKVFGDIDDDSTVRNAGNVEDCYGYYDIPNQKVRVFYVNTVDVPQKFYPALNKLNYRAQWDTGISVEQLQFIADHLKFAEAGWRVMVFSHHPIQRDITIENGCGVSADRGGAALLELLDKFNTTSASGSISVTGTDFEGTVSYDFKKNVDCKMIACVNGHTHRDNVEIYNDSYFCISTRAVYGHPSHDGHISSSAYFVVDRNNDKLHLLYNGDGEENVFDYRNLTVVEDGADDGEAVYEEIASPYEWQIGVINDTTGALEADSQMLRIASNGIVGFTKPALIDMSAASCMYVPYWYDTDGNYIGCGTSWISCTAPLEIPVDRTCSLKIRKTNWGTWADTDISNFGSSIDVYVQTGGESYIIGEEPSEPDVPDEPDEPTDDTVEIASPFEWQIGILNDTTGVLESDSASMRISTNKPVGFTTPAIIDMSANRNDWYVPYWYDTEGTYIECESGWISASVPLEVPVGKAIGIKVRHNNYELWEDASITSFADKVIVYVEEGGEAYFVDVSVPDEPEEPTIELGKPVENVIYAIGASASTGTVGMDVYGNAPRMTALVTYGIKPISDINNKVGEEAYFIAIPADATKITVTCPNFIYAFQFLKYENDAYTKVSDPGWQTLGGGSATFEAGAYTHVAINYKNSSNANIPADTDTSGFSIVFE